MILRDVDLSQKERKLLLAGGIKELMNQRDVVDSKEQLVSNLKNLLNK